MKNWGVITIGDLEIEVAYIVQIVIIISVTIVLTSIVRVLMNRFILRSSTYLKIDKTRIKFFKNAINWLIYLFAIIAIIHSIPPLRTISTTLLTGAGILAAVIGFASQQAMSNIISGVFVVLSRPFRVGDVIRIGKDVSLMNDLVGTVEDITLRHTVIRDFQNRRIIIPNSVINMETIINNNIIDERSRRYFHIVIAFEADITKAIEIIQDEVKKHPYYIDGRNYDEKRMGEPEVPVNVVKLLDHGLQLRANVWAPNFDLGWELYCHLNKVVVERFIKEGIEIAYPHHVILQKNQLKS